jgi:hypothetical protein
MSCGRCMVDVWFFHRLRISDNASARLFRWITLFYSRYSSRKCALLVPVIRLFPRRTLCRTADCVTAFVGGVVCLPFVASTDAMTFRSLVGMRAGSRRRAVFRFPWGGSILPSIGMQSTRIPSATLHFRAADRPTAEPLEVGLGGKTCAPISVLC